LLGPRHDAWPGFFSIDSLRGVWVLVVDADPRRRRSLVDVLTCSGALVTPIASATKTFEVMRRASHVGAPAR
jgi:hypothetical protein